MVPSKPLKPKISMLPAVPTKSLGVKTRSQISVPGAKKDPLPKRKAECSPPKGKTVKRSAFGDLSNALGKTNNASEGLLKKSNAASSQFKPLVKGVPVAKKSSMISKKLKENALDPSLHLDKTRLSVLANVKPLVTAAATRPSLLTLGGGARRCSKPKTEPVATKAKAAPVATTNAKPALVASPKPHPPVASGMMTRQSSGRPSINTSEDSSLYVSALEEILDESTAKKVEVGENGSQIYETLTLAPSRQPPPGIDDFDKENLHDPNQVAVYAMDIFEYLKTRECRFIVSDYMCHQDKINKWMRSLLVDWMVEVQEQFELNHETLYLSVKLVDLFLSKHAVTKDGLQLVGCAAMFVACKFDERLPPLIEDFLYICNGAYSHKALIQMEIKLLKAIDYDLGVPLSYRFLRRYARCIKAQLPLLTLARYVLELALMEYSVIFLSDSKLAAAALLLALLMKGVSGWTPALQYYSGYNREDIKDIVHLLNGILHKPAKEPLMTVRNKYSHKTFFEVAKTPLIDDLEL